MRRLKRQFFCFIKVFTVQFDEFVHGKWMPFNGTDVQLEFVRIDPFVRTTMKNKGMKNDELISFNKKKFRRST